jgi:hypothetical protein
MNIITIKCLLIFSVLFLNLNFIFCQEEYKTDTIIYKKKGKPYILMPHWKVGRIDTFKYSRIDKIIEYGDTIKNEQIVSQIIHKVESINDTAIVQVAKIGKEIYQKQVFFKDFRPQDPLIKDFYTVVYMTNRNGTNIRILNCTELQKHLLPDLQLSIDFAKSKNMSGLNLFESQLNNMKECKSAQSFLTNDLVMFHQIYNQLVPKKDTLKYQIKSTQIADSKKEISLYYQINVVEKKGNKIFEISEDAAKGDSYRDILQKELEETLDKDDETFGKDDMDFNVISEDKTTIEVDVENYPVAIKRVMQSIEKSKEGTSIDLFEYRIEKLGRY